jgi:hypothetical protein
LYRVTVARRPVPISEPSYGNTADRDKQPAHRLGVAAHDCGGGVGVAGGVKALLGEGETGAPAKLP